MTARRRSGTRTRALGPVAGSLLVLVLAACGAGPRDVMLGTDECALCRMSVTEPGFATQLSTTRGRAYVFDSIECLAEFLDRGDVPADRVAAVWVTDFANPGTWVPAGDAHFLRSESLRSPMGMNLSGYLERTAAEAHRAEYGGEILDWPAVRAAVAAGGARARGNDHAH